MKNFGIEKDKSHKVGDQKSEGKTYTGWNKNEERKQKTGSRPIYYWNTDEKERSEVLGKTYSGWNKNEEREQKPSSEPIYVLTKKGEEKTASEPIYVPIYVWAKREEDSSDALGKTYSGWNKNKELEQKPNSEPIYVLTKKGEEGKSYAGWEKKEEFEEKSSSEPIYVLTKMDDKRTGVLGKTYSGWNKNEELEQKPNLTSPHLT